MTATTAQPETTEVRTFRAPTMQRALDIVREEMGREAVILHTRQIPVRRLLPWRKPLEEVEITAGLGVNVRSHAPPRPAAPAPRPAPAPVSRLDGGISLEISQAAQALARQTEPKSDPSVDFAGKLDSIQKMLADLGRTGSLRRSEEIPDELFTLYTELIDAEVEENLARELIFRVRDNATPNQLSDVDAARTLATALVEAEIACRGPIRLTPGRRKVVALVGTTGVGKTTTIAKLAANFRLRENVRMGLVTVDTYRIAAVEQLRTYAEIIDLPMKVVTSPPEMRRAMDELAGLDLVLIDTAGRSPRDELQIKELKSLLADANVDEVQLVLSLTASVRSLLATAEKFAPAGVTSLILTKLDEAAGLGALLSLLRKLSLPISYLTTGQDVPDDIEPAQAARIARLVLGRDLISD